MRPKEISVSVGATINLGNYENLKPLANIVMELDEGDDVHEAYQAAWEVVVSQIRDQWKTVKSAKV